MANNEQINSMINQLSQRLNADSTQVKEALQKGNLDNRQKKTAEFPPTLKSRKRCFQLRRRRR